MANGRCLVRLGYVGGRLQADIAGEIDHHVVAQIREQIDRSILLHRPAEVVLNMENVGFMDSSGLGLVVGRVKVAQSVGATLTVVGADSRIRKIFDLAGLERLKGLRVEEAAV